MVAIHRGAIWPLYIYAVLVIFLHFHSAASQQVPTECVQYAKPDFSQPSGYSTAFYECVNRRTGRLLVLAVVIPLIPALILDYALRRKKSKKSTSHDAEE